MSWLESSAELRWAHSCVQGVAGILPLSAPPAHLSWGSSRLGSAGQLAELSWPAQGSAAGWCWRARVSSALPHTSSTRFLGPEGQSPPTLPDNGRRGHKHGASEAPGSELTTVTFTYPVSPSKSYGQTRVKGREINSSSFVLELQATRHRASMDRVKNQGKSDLLQCLATRIGGYLDISGISGPVTSEGGRPIAGVQARS